MSMPEWKPPQRSPYSDVTGPCTGQMNPPLVGLANELPFGVSFPRPLSFAAVDGPLDDSSARILASSDARAAISPWRPWMRVCRAS